MNRFWSFIVGFLSSFVLITSTDFDTYGGGLIKLIPYIGPAVLGGLIFSVLIDLGKEIDKIKDDINKLKEHND